MQSRGSTFWLLSGLAALCVDAFGAAQPPPYLIEASVSLESSQTNRLSSGRAVVTFVQSNGWWEVEADYGSTGPDMVKIENTRKVPGGTLSYLRFGGREVLKPVAINCPVSHPSDSLLYDAWVSFSAGAELPLIDATRIRRNLDLPGCFVKLCNAPENEGLYAIEYLKEAKTFVSSLLITNRGFALDIEVKGNGVLGTQIMGLRTQFLEYEQKVLATTNIAGWTIPSHIETKRYGFTWSKGVAVPCLMKRTELKATRITFAPEDLATHAATRMPPPQLEEYLVVNDEWKSVKGEKER
jgi:hypothetical protein